jgi:hypothetical protein
MAVTADDAVRSATPWSHENQEAEIKTTILFWSQERLLQEKPWN